MFKILLFGLILGCATAQAEAKFRTKCVADLSGIQAALPRMEAVSAFFENSHSGYGRSRCALALGEVRLIAGFGMERPFLASEVGPTLTVQLFKGNPVAGKLNRLRIQGMHLDQWAIGQSQTFYGEEFVNFECHEQCVTRIDYACTVTRML